jgi:hypothetical protein
MPLHRRLTPLERKLFKLKELKLKERRSELNRIISLLAHQLKYLGAVAVIDSNALLRRTGDHWHRGCREASVAATSAS